MNTRRYIARFERLDGVGPNGTAIGYGLSDGARIWDLTGHFSTWAQLLNAVTDTPDAVDRLIAGSPELALAAVRLLAPWDGSGRVFGVALNYKSHVIEVNREVPDEPIIFMIPDTALIGPTDEISGVNRCGFLDYEGELAVVIGRTASNLAEDGAKAVIAGTTLFNDVTARDLMFPVPEKRGIPDWLSAKGLDNSTPLGPWILRADCGGDPEALEFTAAHNGEQVQRGVSDDLVFSVSYVLSFLSERLTLRAGDVIALGTPTGTGRGRGVPLRGGDVFTVTCAQIGTLENRVGL